MLQHTAQKQRQQLGGCGCNLSQNRKPVDWPRSPGFCNFLDILFCKTKGATADWHDVYAVNS